MLQVVRWAVRTVIRGGYQQGWGWCWHGGCLLGWWCRGGGEEFVAVGGGGWPEEGRRVAAATAELRSRKRSREVWDAHQLRHRGSSGHLVWRLARAKVGVGHHARVRRSLPGHRHTEGTCGVDRGWRRTRKVKHGLTERAGEGVRFFKLYRRAAACEFLRMRCR